MARNEAKYTITAVDRTKRALDSASRGFKGLDSAVAKVSAGVAALAGAAAMGALVKSTVESTDKLAKMSTQLGISAQALAELEYGAERSGSNVDQLGVALATMQKNLTDATRGTGEAIIALQELGIQADDLRGMNADQQFRVLADAISRLTDDAQKTNIAMKVFGESGRALIPMLNGGSAGVDEFARRFRMLTGDALNDREIGKVEALKDQFDDITTAIRYNLMKALIALAPHLESLMSWAVDFVSFDLPKFFETFGGAVSRFGKLLDVLFNKWTLITSGFIAGTWAITNIVVIMSGFMTRVAVWSASGGILSNLLVLVKMLGVQFKAFAATLGLLNPWVLAITAIAGSMIGFFKKWSEKSKDAADNINDLADALERVNDAQRRMILTERIQKLETEKDSIRERIDSLRGRDLTSEARKLSTNAKDVAGNLRILREGVNAEVNELNNRLDGIADELNDAYSRLTKLPFVGPDTIPAGFGSMPGDRLSRLGLPSNEDLQMGKAVEASGKLVQGAEAVRMGLSQGAQHLIWAVDTLTAGVSEFSNTLASTVGDAIRNWDTVSAFSQLADNFGRMLERAGLNALAVIAERGVKKLMDAILESLLDAGLSQIPVIGPILATLTDVNTGSAGTDSAGRSNPGGGGSGRVVNVNNFNTVLPPTQEDLRRAEQTFNEVNMAGARFAL